MKGVMYMKERFNIMLPYMVADKTNIEYTNDIRALVKYLRDLGIAVLDLKESDILDQFNIPIEHVYILECFGETSVASRIFSNSIMDRYCKTVLFN